MPLQADDHFLRLARFLEMESRAEAERARELAQRLAGPDAERTGTSLVDLVVAEEHSGLGGRCLVTLVKRHRTQALPWTRLQVGSPVLLSVEAARAAAGLRGVVCERDDYRVRVALNDPPEESADRTT